MASNEETFTVWRFWWFDAGKNAISLQITACHFMSTFCALHLAFDVFGVKMLSCAYKVKHLVNFFRRCHVCRPWQLGLLEDFISPAPLTNPLWLEGWGEAALMLRRNRFDEHHSGMRQVYTLLKKTNHLALSDFLLSLGRGMSHGQEQEIVK